MAWSLFTLSSSDYFIPDTEINVSPSALGKIFAKTDENANEDNELKQGQEILKKKKKNQAVLPNNGVLTGFVFGFSLHTDDLNPTGVEWSGNAHL